MNSGLKFHWILPEETPKGMAAINDLWRKDHILARDEALFRWQYARGPHPGRMGFLLAEDGGEAVGLSGMISLPWHDHGRPLLGGVGAITVIAPKYRLKNAGLELMAEGDRGMAVVGSFGINERVARLYKYQGRYVSPSFPRSLCIGDEPAMDAWLENYAWPVEERAKIRDVCSRLRQKSLPSGYQLEKLTKANLSEWDLTWREKFAPQLCGVARTGEYLNWRYLEHPRFVYEAFILRDSQGRIQGLAVFRIIDFAGGIKALRILDFLANDENMGRILAAGLSELVPENCAWLEFFALGTQGIALGEIGLTQAGADLVSVYTNPPDPGHTRILSAMLVKVPGYSPQEFAEHKDMYVTLADGDQDRPN